MFLSKVLHKKDELSLNSQLMHCMSVLRNFRITKKESYHLAELKLLKVRLLFVEYQGRLISQAHRVSTV